MIKVSMASAEETKSAREHAARHELRPCSRPSGRRWNATVESQGEEWSSQVRDIEHRFRLRHKPFVTMDSFIVTASLFKIYESYDYHSRSI